MSAAEEDFQNEFSSASSAKRESSSTCGDQWPADVESPLVISAAAFDRLYGQSSEAWMVVSVAGQIVWCNRSGWGLLSISGMASRRPNSLESKKEELHRNLCDCCPHWDANGWAEAVQQAQRGEPASFSVRLGRFPRHRILYLTPCELSVATQESHDTEASSLLLIRAERPTQSESWTEEDFVRVIRDCDNEQVVFDPDTLHIQEVSRGALNNLGYRLAELVDHSILSIIPASDHSGFLNDIEVLRQPGSSCERIGVTIERHHGSRYPAEIYLQRAELDSGAVLIAFLIDVTDRRLAERLMRESEERLSRTESFALVMTTYVGLDGRWLKVPPTLCELLGYSEMELLGKTFQQVTFEEDSEIEWTQCQRLLRRELKSFDLEKRFRHRDGHVVWVYLNSSVVLDEEDQPVHFLSYIRDISALKVEKERQRQFEAQLQNAQRLESLGVLAGGIAHDFNNLLMGIVGNASLALLDLSPLSPAFESIQQIETAGLRAAELCKQMLAYSGRGKFIVRPVNLSELVEEMFHLLEVSISKRAVLRRSLPMKIPAIEADASQIRQVVMNFITNASDAIGDRHGLISINVGVCETESDPSPGTYLVDDIPAGRYVYFEIVDTGCGMDEETKKRLFEPFFTTKQTGRGLGLAAVLGIVRSHRGAIQCESEIGRGTTFRVYFPALADTALPATPIIPTVPIHQAGATVLLVDDEETVRTVAKRMLERIGLKVLLAHDGVDAIEVYRQNQSQIEVVLLDMMMPQLSGEETYSELRLINPEVKVILCSGYNEQVIADCVGDPKRIAFIQKPYQPAQLVEKLRQMLPHSFH